MRWTGPKPGEFGQARPGVVGSLPEAPLGGRRPAARRGQLTGGQRGLGPGELRFGKILIKPLPPGRGHRGVQLIGRVDGEPGRKQGAGLIHRQHEEKARRAQPVHVSGRVEELKRGGNVARQQVAVTHVVQRLGRDQVVALSRRDAAAPDQVGSRPPDLTEVEVGEAAIEQCTS